MREPLLWGSLAMRIVLLMIVLVVGGWSGGDTHHYVRVSGLVCGGEWGDGHGRPGLYAWFLCALSPGLKAGAANWSFVALPLAIQSALIWLGGVALWKLWPRVRSRRAIVALWLLDPVLLAYGGLVMSDGLFATMALAAAMLGWKVWSGERRESVGLWVAAGLGVALGAMALTRSVGLPLLAWTGVFAVATFWRRPAVPALGALACMVCIAPQLYWNVTRHAAWSIQQQSGWISTIVAVVEHADPGIDFYEAEERWVKDPRYGDKVESIKVIVERFPRFAYFTAKGMARVLFGHVNVEWATLLTGTSPIGPGWFKVPEQRAGPQVQGFWLLPWVAGLLLTFGLTLYAYFKTARAVAVVGLDAFSVWALGCASLLAITPLLWGDARFRAPIWPFILTVWAAAEARRATSSSRAEC